MYVAAGLLLASWLSRCGPQLATATRIVSEATTTPSRCTDAFGLEPFCVLLAI
jgi:hypothetical protein